MPRTGRGWPKGIAHPSSEFLPVRRHWAEL